MKIFQLCKGAVSTNRPDTRSTSTSLSAGSSTCDTPSGDEATNNSSSGPEPVQFSTSPPVDVHKPRRSLSPPAFGFSALQTRVGHVSSTTHAHNVSSSTQHVSHRSNSTKLGNFSNSLGDLSTLEYDNSEKRVKKSISPRYK